MLPQLLLLLLLLLSPDSGHGCHGPELDRALVLAKVRALFMDALGPPALAGEGGDPGVRRLPRRHAPGGFRRRGWEPREEEDVSQAILFPATGNEGGKWQGDFEEQCGRYSTGSGARQVWL